jgi:UDP-3-O-[3-hydroxymyristoyl] glucosamine N-acyltransferase
MKPKYSLQTLAEMTGSQLIGDPEYFISGVDVLETASSEDVSFLANPRYREQMKNSKAGVVCVDSSVELPPNRNFLVSDNPSKTIQIIAELVLQCAERESGFHGVHPTAAIHPEATLGKDVQIGPYVVIDRGTKVGDRCQIHAHVSISAGCEVGSDCILYPHSVVREGCRLGNRVILQPGAIIGSCGFGYLTTTTGNHEKLAQLGIVILEDDVEIGANTTIDRARFKETKIGKGTKIDNLVQVGHNVVLGHNNLIVSQTGIAGSAKTGRNVVMGGQAGIVGHVEIADFVMIATRGGVSKSMPEAGKFAGSPVLPLPEYNRQQVLLRKIEEYVDRIEKLEAKLSELEEKSASC